MTKPGTALRTYIPLPPTTVPERGGIVSVLNSQQRSGPWMVPRHFRIACIMGSVELDMREARFSEEETVVEIKAIMGSVELLLPPGVEIVMDGDALMGSYELQNDATSVLAPDAPRIRLTGDAIMGSVEVAVRYAGESKRAAARRIKAAHR